MKRRAVDGSCTPVSNRPPDPHVSFMMQKKRALKWMLMQQCDNDRRIPQVVTRARAGDCREATMLLAAFIYGCFGSIINMRKELFRRKITCIDEVNLTSFADGN